MLRLSSRDLVGASTPPTPLQRRGCRSLRERLDSPSRGKVSQTHSRRAIMPPATTLLIFLFLSVAHAQEVATLSIDSGGVVRVQSGGVLEVGDPPPPPPPPPSPPPALPPATALERRPGGGWRYDRRPRPLVRRVPREWLPPYRALNGGESGAFDIGPRDPT